MRARWMVIVFGPAAILVIGSVLALLFLPHPVPREATPGQRLYLTRCAECHGANGHGSWRATLFLLRPGNLADPTTLAPRSDGYLFNLVKDGGASIGKPGMPAFGYHLSDEQIREVIRYIRGLAGPPPPRVRLHDSEPASSSSRAPGAAARHLPQAPPTSSLVGEQVAEELAGRSRAPRREATPDGGRRGVLSVRRAAAKDTTQMGLFQQPASRGEAPRRGSPAAGYDRTAWQ